jgi:DNA-binding beta-propeller fold protein YncE
LLSALALGAVCSCSEQGEPRIERVYDSYNGSAYPNHRPAIAYPATGTGVVSDSQSDTLSMIDRATGQRFANPFVGLNPVDIDGPHHLAIDVATRAVYVALSYQPLVFSGSPHAAHSSAQQPGYVQKLALDDLEPLGALRVETNPGDIVLSEDGARLVVTHFDVNKALKAPDLESARSNMIVIDAKTLGTTAPIFRRIPVCAAAHGVALSRPDGARAWVACYGEDAIAVVDLTNPDAPIERTPVGLGAQPRSSVFGPYSAVLSPDSKLLAVGCTESNELRIFDVTTSPITLKKTLRPDGTPYFPAWSADQTRLYVPTHADLLVAYDVSADFAEVDRRYFTKQECDKPHEVVAAEDGLWVVCEGGHAASPKVPGTVLRVDPAPGLAITSSTEVGYYPDRIVLLGADK